MLEELVTHVAHIGGLNNEILAELVLYG